MEDDPTRVAVSIGMLRGGERKSWLPAFDRDAKKIAFHPDPANGPEVTAIPVADVAYVAFERRLPSLPVAPIDTIRCRIHVVGDRPFLVDVGQAELEDPRGCFAVPSSAKGSPACFYFFRHGINVCEQDRPIGALLLRDGLVAEQDVGAGSRCRRKCVRRSAISSWRRASSAAPICCTLRGCRKGGASVSARFSSTRAW